MVYSKTYDCKIIKTIPSDFDVNIGDTITLVFYDYDVFVSCDKITKIQSILDDKEISLRAGSKLTGILIGCKFLFNKQGDKIGIWNIVIKHKDLYYYPMFSLRTKPISAIPVTTRMVLSDKKNHLVIRRR